ncbi:hypothetical protein M422DRAFT_272064 [Sphaerobolus stellatus SS14]|uniref:Uncharacterized protein n=1 Tax=Sphaerobolus stellatus (strain SS14) TaxID=990650 RepID=A0A0C9UCD0_SPHS4|nr:hypothetical protein M422DRAFT_272064 [Sphaerobolus stellatus SS14]
MSYRQPISDEQLAPFLEAANAIRVPKRNNLGDESGHDSASHQDERREHEGEAKRKAEEDAAKKKAEEAVAKKAAEEENERAMDANSEGEDEVNQDETPRSKSKSKKMRSRSIVDSESEEETEEVKAKRRKAKGKGKAVDSDYKRNTVPVDYSGCPGVPVHKICKGCKVLANAKYQRPCMGDVLMDANDKIFYVRSKNRCFVCLLRNNFCSFAREDEAEFIMPEAADDEELQAKLKKLCDEQDTFKEQKDKEKSERSKNVGNRTKVGTKKTVQVNTKASGSNAKASGSTPKGSKRKVVCEEDDIAVEARPKRARTVANSTGSNERIPSVAESLHGINQALIQTVTLLGDNRAANEHTARYLRGIETCMANLQYAMQAHVRQVHNRLGELERQTGIWPMEDEEHADEEVEPVEPEDMEEEVEEVREEDMEDREVEEDETMKDPEADEL